MTQINWTAKVTNLAQRVKNSASYTCYSCGEHDPGYVDPRVLPALAHYAAQLGYPVSLATREELGPHVLGSTSHGRPNPRNLAKGIHLLEDMSDASTVRVLGHEIGHALTGEEPVYWLEVAIFGEAVGEEVAAELGTETFTELEGIGTREFAHHYLGQRLGGRMPPEWVIERAVRNARKLYEAVHGLN